jgi:hypothetical protein
MMKKLLVLMLVLGVASMATAGLTWSQSDITVAVGVPFTVTLSTSDLVQGFAFLEPGGGVAVTGVSMYAGAGDDAYYTVYTSGPSVGWAQVAISDAGAPFNNAIGPVFDITMVASAAGSMGSDYYGKFGASDTLTVNIIPEPITMGLLAVGGLFLRRRK